MARTTSPWARRKLADSPEPESERLRNCRAASYSVGSARVHQIARDHERIESLGVLLTQVNGELRVEDRRLSAGARLRA
jgi:hypothetical protein